MTLLDLDEKEGAYRSVAHALAGQTFETEVPFAISFDPIEVPEH